MIGLGDEAFASRQKWRPFIGLEWMGNVFISSLRVRPIRRLLFPLTSAERDTSILSQFCEMEQTDVETAFGKTSRPLFYLKPEQEAFAVYSVRQCAVLPRQVGDDEPDFAHLSSGALPIKWMSACSLGTDV